MPPLEAAERFVAETGIALGDPPGQLFARVRAADGVLSSAASDDPADEIAVVYSQFLLECEGQGAWTADNVKRAGKQLRSAAKAIRYVFAEGGVVPWCCRSLIGGEQDALRELGEMRADPHVPPDLATFGRWARALISALDTAALHAERATFRRTRPVVRPERNFVRWFSSKSRRWTLSRRQIALLYIAADIEAQPDRPGGRALGWEYHVPSVLRRVRDLERREDPMLRKLLITKRPAKSKTRTRPAGRERTRRSR